MVDLEYRRFSVSARDKRPLLQFLLNALEKCGCGVLRHSGPEEAPFRISFEAPDGERLGIIAYAFRANHRLTRNRPQDEHRFQVKYGTKTGELYELWQDPYEIYTTIFLGINLEEEFFVGVDPVLHSPTRFFISVEFKQSHADAISEKGWHAWERQKRDREGLDEPVEILVGGTPTSFLRYVRFERAAKGLDTGHRGLLVDKLTEIEGLRAPAAESLDRVQVPTAQMHHLASEFALEPGEILDLIASAPRLKMAVRGWVAERHLVQKLTELPDITECRAIEEDGRPDVAVSLHGSRPILIECKNTLRRPYSDGMPRVDFQRTRAAKGDPCSRYYAPGEFDMVAACLHPQTERWEFTFALTGDLDPHAKCAGKLSNKVRIDDRWSEDTIAVLERALR